MVFFKKTSGNLTILRSLRTSGEGVSRFIVVELAAGSWSFHDTKHHAPAPGHWVHDFPSWHACADHACGMTAWDS